MCRDEVALALVAGERAGERDDRLLWLCAEQEHLSEVGIRISERVGLVGPLADRHRFAREPLGFGILAAAPEHPSPHLAPDHLCERILARAEFRCPAGPRVRLLEPVECEECPRQAPGRARQEAPVLQVLEHPAPFRTELGGGGGIAGQELEFDGLDPGRDREPDPPAALGHLGTCPGEHRSCLVGATEHRQRQGAVHAEPVVQSRPRLVLVQPRQEFRHGCRAVETTTGAPLEELLRQARVPSMGGGALVRLQRRVHMSSLELHLREPVVDGVEGEIVAGGLKEGLRLRDERRQPLGRALRLQGHADDARLDPRAQLTQLVPRG